MRLAPCLAGLLCMAIATVLYAYGSAGFYHGAFEIWGVHAFRYPFLDVDGTLAARDCARLGIDVFVLNPCDILDRVHNYSPLWLVFPDLPPGHSDRVFVGYTMDMAFFISLAALPPAGDRQELLLRVAGTVSTAVAYATERANVDTVVFVLVIGAAVAMSGGFAVRWLGYALAALAAGLKYYPATLMALALRERPARLVGTWLTAAVLGGCFLTAYGHDLLLSLPNIPGGVAFGDVFGAEDLRYEVSALLAPTSASQQTTVLVSWAVVATAILLAASLVVGLWRRNDWSGALDRLNDARRWPLLAGALVTVGCFVAGQNLDYRGIFILLLLPGLWTLGHDPAVRSWLPRSSAILAVLLMWEQAPRHWIEMLDEGTGLPRAASEAFVMELWFDVWVVREAAYWALMVVLLSVLAAFVARSPVLCKMRRMLPRHTIVS